MVFATSANVDILNKSPTLVSTDNPGTGNWSIFEGATSTDVLLEGEDKFTILAKPKVALVENQEFNLEIRPSTGASFGLKRTIPAKINAVNLLY